MQPTGELPNPSAIFNTPGFDFMSNRLPGYHHIADATAAGTPGLVVGFFPYGAESRYAVERVVGGLDLDSLTRLRDLHAAQIDQLRSCGVDIVPHRWEVTPIMPQSRSGQSARLFMCAPKLEGLPLTAENTLGHTALAALLEYYGGSHREDYVLSGIAGPSCFSVVADNDHGPTAILHAVDPILQDASDIYKIVGRERFGLWVSKVADTALRYELEELRQLLIG